jgi:hypothetical protein
MRTIPAIPIGAVLLAMPAPGPAAAQEYYSDVRPILVQNCVQCHAETGLAWSMEDPEEAFRNRQAIAAAILDRRMPPWIAQGGIQAYHDDPSLSDYVLELVRDWRDGGFVKGDPRPDPLLDRQASHGAHGARPGGAAFQPDLSLEVLPDGGSYLPNQRRADDYRCFVVDWTDDEPSYVTGFRAVPGNELVAHHMVVYSVSPEMVERFRELEDVEEGQGYQCFGGALPDRLGQREDREAYEARYPDGVRELSLSNFWLSHWAPGMDGHRFPEGTGILVEPGSALVVQMHYYGLEAPGERDSGTRMDFQIAREVERPALHFPQTRNAWLAGERNGSMVIPPGERATYEVADDLEDLVGYIARVTQVDRDRIHGLELHSVNLHMHAFGESGMVTLRDRNGRKETLLSVPRWDLRWQRDFTLVEPRVFSREELEGTSLAVQCTFHNPRTEPVFGGYGSYDEMCFNFSYIAVRSGEPRVEDGSGRPEPH